MKNKEQKYKSQLFLRLSSNKDHINRSRIGRKNQKTFQEIKMNNTLNKTLSLNTLPPSSSSSDVNINLADTTWTLVRKDECIILNKTFMLH